MGTSGSFKGSGGKDASDLRGAIADWLDDGAQPPAVDSTNADRPLDPRAVAPVVRLWRSGSGSGSGSGGGGATSGGSGGGGGTGGGRSSGGVQRTVARVAGPAGRAGTLARAYSTGDRDALASAGLNYGELRALNDPLEVGKRIAEAAFDTQPDSTLEDSESRIIVAELIAWILEAPDDRPPGPDDVVRQSIELMMAKSALLEVGETIRKEKNQAKRREAEQEVRRAAHVLASQVPLGAVGTSAAEITSAIESGVAALKDIYGGSE